MAKGVLNQACPYLSLGNKGGTGIVLGLFVTHTWDLDTGLPNVLLHVPRPALLVLKGLATRLALVTLEVVEMFS